MVSAISIIVWMEKKYQPVGEPFTARQGKWIGAKVGLFSTAPFGKDRGWVDADWFRIEK